jgi:hypothetical protein
MRSQPCHIEGLIEKNTLAAILRDIFAEFTIPMTIGRGFCSLPPRYGIANRFALSGKERLVLIVVADFDCEGESIAESFGRSMRDDFNIGSVHAIKAALTADQVQEFKLPPGAKAKQGSSRYAGFVEKYGDDVFELEALSPEVLQRVVREHIDAVVDQDAYEAEVRTEREDSIFLKKVRKKVTGYLQSTNLSEGG